MARMISTLCIAFLVILHSCQGTDEVQYSRKIESDTKGDYFGISIGTTNNHVAVGAPYDNNNKGSVTLQPGVKISPPKGNHFGKHVGMNKEFIAVSGEHPTYVHVFSNKAPYKLKVGVPLDNGFTVAALEIAGDNEIAVATYFGDRGFLSIYDYDSGYSAWHLAQKILLPDWKDYGSDSYISLSLWDEAVAVGYRSASSKDGQVVIYQKQGEKFSISQTIRPPELSHFFGVSIAMFGTHLAVSSSKGNHENAIFTYRLDSAGSWVNNGKLVVPGNGDDGYYGFITIQWGTLAVTVTNKEKYPEVCAFVYEISHGKWEHIATLKTKGEPLKSDYQSHASVSIQNGMVFTGRVNAFGTEKGAVFVHELPEH